MNLSQFHHRVWGGYLAPRGVVGWPTMASIHTQPLPVCANVSLLCEYMYVCPNIHILQDIKENILSIIKASRKCLEMLHDGGDKTERDRDRQSPMMAMLFSFFF